LGAGCSSPTRLPQTEEDPGDNKDAAGIGFIGKVFEILVPGIMDESNKNSGITVSLVLES
jgi:hypothetical protein